MCTFGKSGFKTEILILSTLANKTPVSYQFCLTFNLAEKKQSSGFNDVTNKKWYYMWELRLNVSYPNSTRDWRQTVILDSDLTLSKHYGFGWLFDNKRNHAEIDVNLMGFWFEEISFGNN